MKKPLPVIRVRVKPSFNLYQYIEEGPAEVAEIASTGYAEVFGRKIGGKEGERQDFAVSPEHWEFDYQAMQAELAKRTGAQMTAQAAPNQLKAVLG